MTSETRYTELSLERPRKYPAGLPVRLSVRCLECSRHCTIDLRLPDAFPSAYVAMTEGVFSSLCEKLGKLDAETASPDGQQKVL